MSDFVLGDLTIDVEQVEPSRIALHWNGQSNSRNPYEGLRAFFSLVFARATTLNVILELHFERLKHFNSSTVAAVIRLCEEARARAIKLELVYDGSARWQAHSFKAMAVLERPDGMLKLRAVSSGAQAEAIGRDGLPGADAPSSR